MVRRLSLCANCYTVRVLKFSGETEQGERQRGTESPGDRTGPSAALCQVSGLGTRMSLLLRSAFPGAAPTPGFPTPLTPPSASLP